MFSGFSECSSYFNNLVALWDELDMLLRPLECDCHTRKKILKREEQQRLMKFLHGLNSVYEQSRSQILLLEPLPSIDRAYAMIIQVEDELSLNTELHEGPNMVAMHDSDGYAYDNQALVVGGRLNLFKRRLSKEKKEKTKVQTL